MTYARTNLHTLVDMMRVCRPAGSKSERNFIREFIEPLGVERDAAGNLIKTIGNSPVLWSCHTDTVHKEPGHQKITIRGDLLCVPLSSKRDCLGADDTAGIWLMREMIHAGTAGMYIFHRGEEVGGIGSKYIADMTPGLLSGIKFAIALDRKGFHDVITHQGYGRCCSDAFAQSLAKELGMGYRPDSTGLFTDTANYMHAIPECTNLSVGYAHAHSSMETQSISHLVELRDALIALDVDKLKMERDPDEQTGWSDYLEGANRSGWQWDIYSDRSERDDWHSSYGSLTDLVRRFPDEVADILLEQGIDATTLRDEINFRAPYGR